MSGERNGNGYVRVALDTAILLWLVALAFYAGILTQRVDDLREAVTTPGRVQISIEASTRLTALETSDERQERRLQDLESIARLIE